MAAKKKEVSPGAALVAQRWKRTKASERTKIMREVAKKGWVTRRKRLRKKLKPPKKST